MVSVAVPVPRTLLGLPAFGFKMIVITPTSPTTPLLSFTRETFEKVLHLYLCFLQSPSQLLSWYKSEKGNPDWQKLVTVCFWFWMFLPFLTCLFANITTGACPDHVGKAGSRAHDAIFEVDLCYLSSIFYFVCSGSSSM